MDLLLIQSQEHETLPLAELKAVLDTEKIRTNIENITNGLIVLNSLNEDDFLKNYNILTDRLGYTHEIDELILRTNFEDLKNDFKNINWTKYIEKDFAVRVKRYNKNKLEIDPLAIEKKLGHIILTSQDISASVNLENPKSFIRVVVTPKEIFIGIERIKLNKKHFQEIKPHKRPFFYPGSMSPKLARCMVNLSHVKQGQLLLDPFCGTGGILIEGGMIGAKLIGSDIHWKMKNGTGINLNHCNLSNFEVHHIDVRELKLYEKADAVVTDPPYGISTSTGGEKSENIFYQFLESISKNMKKNAYLAMASPHYLDLDGILIDLDFELIERHEIKMHRSLTRIISVIRKIG